MKVPSPGKCFPSQRRRCLLDLFRKSKSSAIITGFALIYQLVFPAVSYALTGGPSSPDFSSFEPVATTNMVNEFTGQFVYNLPVVEIPGANGSGYALSLSYHAGDGPETESSWVGYGWTLNPGCINRAKRGIPDDYNGNQVKYYNDVPKNWTVAATGQLEAEIFSKFPWAGGLSVYKTIRYNNYKGFGHVDGAGLTLFRGIVSLGYYFSEGTGSFSVAVNPVAVLNYASDKSKRNSEGSGFTSVKQSRSSLVSGIGQSMTQSAVSFIGRASSGAASHYLNYMHSDMSSPYNFTPFSGEMVTGSGHATIDPPPLPSGGTVGVIVSYSEQRNVKERMLNTYGYMYSGHATDNNSSANECIMDYTVENPTPFTKREKYLPVPFSTPDAFFVSGEGVGGCFRMYNSGIGIFSPNYNRSSLTSSYLGFDLHTPPGQDLGLGAEVTLNGGQTLTIKSSWTGGNGNTDDYDFVRYDASNNGISEPVFFRFNNDLGGKVVYESGNKPVEAKITGNSPYLAPDLKLRGDLQVMGVLNRSARASYIGYHTNEEINVTTPPKRALTYEHNEKIHHQAGRQLTSPIANNSAVNDRIGEISVNNEDGSNYVYGLPVYAAGEKNIQKGISTFSSGNSYWMLGTTSNIKVGEEFADPYATAYLLTQITSADYVDVNLNGPDDEDFGGYTRFSYNRIHGTDDKTTYSNWYKWRAPYRGLYYNPMRLSDNEDNMGSYQSGYKEVYYLDTIETKTHFAVFDLDDRWDGYEAESNDDNASSSSNAMGSKRTKKLSKIRLYAKGTQGVSNKLIKTVHFDYDYSCWPNVDNHNTTNGNSPYGKLTLKKVWFEYNGVINAKISPYQFQYSYPTSSQVSYPAKYSGIFNYSSGLNETPYYDNPSSGPTDGDGRYLDCWGNYMSTGYTRRNNLQSWLDQTPATSFDPAAWQLKRIILPSGGEIHVQYESHTYANVQNRPACAMVSLKPGQNYAQATKFYLNLADLDIPSTTAGCNRLRDYIRSYYINTDNKIYFKFFYTLLGSSSANVGDCNGEYVEGYAKVTDVQVETLSGNDVVSVTINRKPHDVCIDNIKKNSGKLKDGNCNAAGSSSMTAPNVNTAEDFVDFGKQLWNSIKASYNAKNSCCKQLNPAYSFLRIPIWNKKGGGIRVKRLLMYNKGIDVNDPTLYGTEYIYDNESTNASYGVATNEPFENKEENPLVTYLQKRLEQDDWDKISAGKDLEEFEGPLGMSAIAAASIGYGKVVKKNIHQTPTTGGGYSEFNYYTAKDFPYDRYYPALDAGGFQTSPIQTVKDEWDVDIGLFEYSIHTGIRSSQGYCFIQNQMHGQLKSVGHYPGMYSATDFNSYPSPVEQTTYSYFEPGERIPMLDPYDSYGYGVYYDQPGKESDITIDRRSITDESHETRYTGDLTLAPFLPIPVVFPIQFPITSSSHNKLNTITTNKIIHYPAILKRITVDKDGSRQHTDHIAFDPLTCKPVVSRTYDAYHGIELSGSGVLHKGAYTSWDFRASSQYPEMGQKAWNERHCYYGNPTVTASSVSNSTDVSFSGINGNGIFHNGDLVAMHYIDGGLHGVRVGHVTKVLTNSIQISPSDRYNSSIPAIAYYKIEIVKSGYTNQLNSSTGGFIEYSNEDIKRSITQLASDMNAALATIIASPTTASATFDLSDYSATIGIGMPALGAPCSTVFSKIHLQKTVNGASTSYDIVFEELGSGTPYPMGITAEINLLNGNVTPPLGFCWTWYWTPSGGNGIPTFAIRYPQVNYWNQNVLNISPWFDHLIQCPAIVEKHIVKASITQYKDNWDYPPQYILNIPTSYNQYETAKRGKWRPDTTRIYNVSTVPGNDLPNGERNYKMAGTAPITLQKWTMTHLLFPENWITSNIVERYSAHGEALEEQDITRLYNSVSYGYEGRLPYATLKQASNNSYKFEGFEHVYNNNTVENDIVIDPQRIVTDTFHTGNRSYKLKPNEKIEIFDNIPEKSGLTPTSTFVSFDFWLRGPAFGTTNLCPLDAKISDPTVTGGYLTIIPKYVVRTGEWTLFSVNTHEEYFPLQNVYTTFVIENLSNDDYMIDDIRIIPRNADPMFYIYDIKNALRLSATLDQDHFATFYQYDSEGKLIRKLKETYLGVKTVEEVHKHSPSVSR